jgi:hypothetical protein
VRPAALLLLAGCATARPAPEAYLASFIQSASEHGVPVDAGIVNFRWVDELPSQSMESGIVDAAASCDTRNHVVIVSRAFWGDNFWSDDSRRAVIYHELGHCLLGLGHDRAMSLHRPRSLMFPEMFGGSVFAQNETDYLDALFATATINRLAAALLDDLGGES